MYCQLLGRLFFMATALAATIPNNNNDNYVSLFTGKPLFGRGLERSLPNDEEHYPLNAPDDSNSALDKRGLFPKERRQENSQILGQHNLALNTRDASDGEFGEKVLDSTSQRRRDVDTIALNGEIHSLNERDEDRFLQTDEKFLNKRDGVASSIDGMAMGYPTSGVGLAMGYPTSGVGLAMGYPTSGVGSSADGTVMGYPVRLIQMQQQMMMMMRQNQMRLQEMYGGGGMLGGGIGSVGGMFGGVGGMFGGGIGSGGGMFGGGIGGGGGMFGGGIGGGGAMFGGGIGSGGGMFGGGIGGGGGMYGGGIGGGGGMFGGDGMYGRGGMYGGFYG